MEREKVYYIVLAVVIIAFIVFGIIAFTLFSSPPEVSVAGVSVSSINLSSISLDLTFIVNNHYPVAIPVKNLEYSVSYVSPKESRILGEGWKQGISMNPGIHEIVIPLTVSNPALVRSAWDVLKTGEIRLLVNGTLTPDLFGLIPPIGFSREILVPVNTGSLLSTIGSLLGS